MTEKLIPIQHVDRAVRRIERWGTLEERAALGEAISIPGSQQSRQAIIAVEQRLLERRGQRVPQRRRGEKIPGWW